MYRKATLKASSYSGESWAEMSVDIMLNAMTHMVPARGERLSQPELKVHCKPRSIQADAQPRE